MIRKLVAAAALALVGMSGIPGIAGAQESAQQGWWGGADDGFTMGPWMMNPYGMMAYGNMAQGMMGPGGRGAVCTRMGSHIEGRLSYLKTELGITGAQKPLWKTYADAVRASTQSIVTNSASVNGMTALAWVITGAEAPTALPPCS